MAMTRDNVLVLQARDVLCRLMREQGATQVQLAQVLGITQVAVSDRVRGKTPLSLADIDLLARHFDVSPAAFVDPVRQSARGLLTSTKYQVAQVIELRSLAA